MAANGLAFGQFVYLASGYESADVPKAPVRGIAVAIATFACTIHMISPRGGIYLSNAFAAVKVTMLVFIILTWVVAAAGGFGNLVGIYTDLLHPQEAFRGSSHAAYSYAEAFLAVCFAYDGWNQANYVSDAASRGSI